MSTFFHGARAEIKVNNSFAVTQAASGVVMAFGTAPVNQVSSWAPIVMAKSFDEFQEQLGYSEDWEKFTLCEVAYVMFKKFGMGPVFFVNVADPAIIKTTVAAAAVAVADGVAKIPETAILSTITVADGEGTALKKGEDYEVLYEDGYCCISAIDGGDMEGLSSVTIGYNKFDPVIADLANAVVGGYNTSTGVSTGIELADDCYAAFQVNPDILIAPGFSHIPTVAAALNAKKTINTVFRSICLVDCAASVQTVTAAAAVKTSNAYNDPDMVLCWPWAKDDDHTYHWSTIVAGEMASVDETQNFIPSESPSNKDNLKITAMCQADGTEIKMNLSRANSLNAAGIVTGLRFLDGFKVWGNYTCARNASTHPEEYFIPVRRMFNWVCNSLVLTYWEFVDSKLTRRLCESIADSASQWINGLTSGGHLYGGRVEFLAEENPDEDIMAGIIRPHVYMAPASPAQEIDFLVEYDASYVSAVLGS